MSESVLHVVHCIDTEGPLSEDLSATFARLQSLFGVELQPSAETLRRLQRKEVPLGGKEAQVAAVLSPQLLAYNRDWGEVRSMLLEAMSPAFRDRMVDDYGNGWAYSWHCVDHLGFVENPRRKDLGYGNVFRFYRDMIAETASSRDELAWHFHPLSVTRSPLAAATSYANSMDVLLYVIARRIIDDNWFPTTNRPGFHAERPDAHAFLEQWIPFDYANQRIDEGVRAQADTLHGRFGDWRRAPDSWRGYHPSHDDYQVPGACRRWIFRCLNLGTRFRLLTDQHVHQAFQEARDGGSAIIAFADHDYRDLRADVEEMRALLRSVRGDYPEVKIRFSGAEEAARQHVMTIDPHLPSDPPRFTLEIIDRRVHVSLVSGTLFGPQPFLALKTRSGEYFHDNLDVIRPGESWTYVLDEQTMQLSALESVGIGGAGRCGGFHTAKVQI